jgi:hypothetical protein
MSGTKNDIVNNGDDQATRQIKFMLDNFAPERYAYLAGTVIAFLLLITCLVVFMITMINKTQGLGKEDLAYVFGMFGSGGIVGLTASRLLRMWKDCMDMITKKNGTN